jgi:DNA-directed RNA polymerase subunit M/transcription elongation factor TFIIS
MNAKRAKTKHVFSAILLKNQKYALLSQDQKDTIVRRIERACYNKSIDIASEMAIDPVVGSQNFIVIYSAECMRILYNIDPDTVADRTLADKIVDGSIDLNKIADMTSEELNPEASKKERDEITLRQNQKTDIKVSRKYKCKKCGGNETIPIEYQSRAADEASSRSIKCVICDNIWRL